MNAIESSSILQVLQGSASRGQSGSRLHRQWMLVVLFFIDRRRWLRDFNVNNATEQGSAVQVFHGTLCLFMGIEVGKARLAVCASHAHDDSPKVVTDEEVGLQYILSVFLIQCRIDTLHFDNSKMTCIRTTSLFFVQVTMLWI